MVDEFELWMMGLDPVRLAATNSFHSTAHRDAMAIHELNKAKFARVVPRDEIVERFQRRHDTPKTTSEMVRLSGPKDTLAHNKTEPVFTPEQIRIANAVLTRKKTKWQN